MSGPRFTPNWQILQKTFPQYMYRADPGLTIACTAPFQNRTLRRAVTSSVRAATDPGHIPPGQLEAKRRRAESRRENCASLSDTVTRCFGTILSKNPDTNGSTGKSTHAVKKYALYLSRSFISKAYGQQLRSPLPTAVPVSVTVTRTP